MKTMSKSAKKLFTAMACVSMLLTFFAGCKQPNAPQKSAEKKLMEFKFEKANNPGLTVDIIGEVNELSKMVDVIVPNGTDIAKLKASFVLSKAASASVKETAQKSGETENDFTNLVYYTITAEDGSKGEYVVHVEVTPASEKFSGKKILAFGFRKAINSGLSKDVEGIVGTIRVPARDKDGNPIKDEKGKPVIEEKRVIFIKFPARTTEATIKSLKPTFIASSKAVLSIGNTKLENSKTTADFYNLTDGINITVTAEDGSTEVYNAAVEVDLPTASKGEVQKYFGSYYGVLESTFLGKNEVVVVLEENKVTMYSTAMSMDYVNVEWEKKADGTYTCTTYKTIYNQDGSIKERRPHIKNLSGKGGYDVIEEGGKITVKTSIMGTPVTLTKGEDFVWEKGSKYKEVTYHI